MLKKRYWKPVAAVALSAMVSAGSFCMMPATAYAGFKIGDAVGGMFGGGGKVDVEGLSERQNKLLTNLVRSTIVLAAAVSDMNEAFGLGLETQETEAASAAGQAAVDSGDAGAMLNFTKGSLDDLEDQKKRDEVQNHIQSALQEAVAEGDPEKLAQLDTLVKTASTERMASDMFVGAAAIDATKILKDANAGLKGEAEMVTKYQQIIDTTNVAQQLLRLRGEVSKMLKEASKEYEKTRKIKIDKSAVDETKASVEKG